MSNTCYINRKNPALYSTLKKSIINGKMGLVINSKFVQLKSEDDSLFNYFTDPKSTFQGMSLSMARRLEMINQIESELPQTTEQKTRDFIKRLKEALGNASPTGTKSEAVNESNAQQQTITANMDSFTTKTLYRMNQESTAKIPILSKSLNQEVLNNIYSKLKEICLWDPKAKSIIDSDKSLTEAVLNFRNEQYNIIRHFLGKPEAFLGNTLTETEANQYQADLLQAWEKIKSLVSQHNGVIDVKSTQETMNSIINPIAAFYLLQDFDSTIENVLGSFITIDPKENGLVIASEDKYKRIKKNKKGQDFNDSIESSSGENLLDNILDTFIANTEYAPGILLGKKFKTTLFSELQNFLTNYNLDESPFEEKESKIKSLRDFKEILNNDETSQEEKVDKLIVLLSEDNKLTEKVGLERCRALAERLNDFQEALQEKYKNVSSQERAQLDKDYNVGNLIINLFNQGLNSFTQIDKDGKIDQLSTSSKKKSKQYVRDHLKTAILRNSKNLQMGLYSDFIQLGPVLSSEISEIFSDSAKEYLTNVTGINFFNEDIIQKFSNPRTLQILKNFLSLLNDEISKTSNLFNSLNIKKEEEVNELLDALSFKEFYKLFSDIIVEENEYTEERLLNLDLTKEMPKSSITILSAQVNRNIKRLRGLTGEGSKNIILRNPRLIQVSEVSYNQGTYVIDSDFIQHISFINEVRLSDGSIKKWVKLNKGELIQEQIGALYLRNFLDHDIISYQIEAASDKAKVPIGSFNTKVDIDGNGTLLERDNTQLLDLAWSQHSDYYTKLEDTLVQNWDTIIKELVSNPPSFRSLQEVKNYFNENKISVSALNAVALKHPEIKFQKEILFSVDKNNNIDINNSLLSEINQAHDINAYEEHNTEALTNFKNYIENNGGLSFLQNFLKSYGKCNLVTQQKLEQLFGIKQTEIKNFFKNGTFDYVTLLQSKEHVDNFIKKYQLLYRICHEADLELCQKQYWCHASNKEVGEETTRIQKSEKRNNSLSATWTPLTVGLKHGVGTTVRYAQVESLRSLTYNMFGNHDKLKAHDGAIFSSYVLRILERNSSLSIDMSKTAKIIALNPDGYGMVQLKCADYSIDNAFIRDSIKKSQYTDQTMDGKIALKKMLSPSKLDSTFYDNFMENAPFGGVNLGLEKVICYFNGRLAYLENYNAIQTSGYLNAKWVYLDDNTRVDGQTVASTLGLEMGENPNTFKVSNLYELWKFFGAEYSMGYTDKGDIDFNDASQEYVAYLMCEFAPHLKEVMIGKLVDPESSKSTQGLTNSRETTFTDNDVELVTQSLEAVQYGMQQDHSHETEESTIPALTQVITAIAFNGQNPRLVQQLYELLGKLTTESLEDLEVMAEAPNRTKFYRKIGQMIYNNLKDNTVISNAQNILEKTLKELGSNKDLFAAKAIPFSDNQIFHIATANMLSKLNQAIRQRFSGVSVVQNPAQGIQGIYEDINHITYKYTDIVKEAMEAYKNGEFTLEPFVSSSVDNIVATYLNNSPKFSTPTTITTQNKHLLNLGYFVSVNGTVIELSTPQKLWEVQEQLQKGATIQLLHNVPRNLATTQIWWSELDGTTSNIWELESTKAVIQENENGTPKTNLNKNWHNANLKGLRDGDENGKYYFKTSDDYKNGFRTYVTNIQYRGGEEILPRIYKEKMGLHDSLSVIKQRGADYFKEIVKQRQELDPSIQLTGKDFALSTNDFDLVFRMNKSVENNGTIIRNGNVASIYDSDSILITKLYLPEDENITVNIKKNNAGKHIISIGLSLDEEIKEKEFRKILNGVDYNRWFGSGVGQDGVWDQIGKKVSELSNAEIAEQAQKMYVSFLTMLKTISARIPSQSFQSFLSNETVAFTEDDSNNGYMNLYEMYFQGSDYDIDHAYTMIFEINSQGLIEGATDFSSPEALMRSLLLPEPNRKAIINIRDSIIGEAKNNTAEIKKIIGDYTENKDMHLLLTRLADLADSQETPLIFIDEGNQIFNKLITTINSYNYDNLSQAAQRNSIMAGIRTASQDLTNLRASQVPMESGPVNKCIDRSVQNYGQKENATVYMDADPSHIVDFQYQGAIGKEGVGISANSIKATGSIQQVINQKHVKDPNSAQMPDMNMKLYFDLGNGTTIDEFLYRVPNTPISKENFREQTLNAIAKGIMGVERSIVQDSEIIKNHPLYNLFEQLQQGVPVTGITAKQNQFIKAYNTLKDFNARSNFGFIDTLYEMVQNEQNAADIESIFISLCTDNAKELQLYRIAGIPALLNLPLTMIAMGMEIQDVTDICVKYIVPIMEDLNKSRLFGNVEQNVEKLITERINKNLKDAPELAKSYQSLLQIAQAASELRFISGFFKINQGVSVRYAETQEFLNNFNKMLSSKGVTIEGDVDPITYEKIFTEGKDYQKAVIQAYENKKTAFNVMDIVLNSPHFYSQLQETYKVYKKINDNVGVANVASTIYKKLQNTENFKEQNSTRIIQVVQNYFISHALKKMTNITFDKWSTLKQYGNWDKILPGNIEIGVSNQVKIEYFINFIENGFIPFLKKNFGNNFFVQSLNLNTRTNKYELPFERDTKGDILSKLEINQASLAFSDICGIQSGIKTLDGDPITYGDLLYLYATITNQNRINPTSSVIESALEKGSKIKPAAAIKSIYQEIDRLTGIASLNPATFSEEDDANGKYKIRAAKNYMEKLAAAVEPYVRARLNEGTYAEGNLLYDIDPKGSYLYTMTAPIIRSDNGINVNRDGIMAMFTGIAEVSSTGTEIVDVEINKDLGEITVIFKNPNLLGNVIEQTVTLAYDRNKDKFLYSDIEDFQKRILPYFSSIQTSLDQALSGESGLLQETAIKDQLTSNYTKMISNLKDLPGFSEWLEKQNKIVILRRGSQMKSHIENINGAKIIVINPVQLKVTENPEFVILNLYLDSIMNKTVGSEVERLTSLLELLNIKTEEKDLSTLLLDKDVQNKIEQNKIISKWVKQTITDMTVTDELKTTCRITLNALTEALQYQDIYYRDLSESSIKNHQLTIGDIFEYEDANRYIYLGKDVNNRCILQNLYDPTDIKVLTSVTTDSRWKCLKTPKIITHFNALNRNLYKNQKYITENGKQRLRRDVLDLGDKVILSGKECTIYNIVYSKEGNIYVPEFIYLNPETDMFETFMLNENEDIYGYKREVIAQTETNQNENPNVFLTNSTPAIKRKIANLMQKGMKFTAQGMNKGEFIFASYNNGFIETTTHQLISASDLESIYNFNINSIPGVQGLNELHFTILPSNEENKIQLIDITKYLLKTRQFSDFEKIIDTAEKALSNKHLSKYILTPVKTFTFGTDKISFKQFSISADLEVTSAIDEYSIIEQGDYVEVDPKTAQDSYSMMQILEINSDGSYTVVKQTQSAKNGSMTTTVESVTKNDLKGAKLLKYNRNAENNRIRYSQTINPEVKNAVDKVQALFDFLAKKFNTTVDIMNDPNADWFARINGGIVQINVGKKPESIDTNQYILQQGIHEFAHLVVADLKTNNIDAYMQLITKMRDSSIAIQKNITENSHYQEGIDSMEEQLVRWITTYMTQDQTSGDGQTTIDFGNSPIIKDAELDGMIQKAFKNFFELKNIISDPTNVSVENTHMDAFVDTRKSTISNLRKQMISNNILNKTMTIECK